MQGRCELGVSFFRGLCGAYVGFSLRLWLLKQRGIRRSSCTRVTMFTALTIRQFKRERISVAFLRASQRAF